MFEGFGKNWAPFDKYVADLAPKPKDVSYKNWYPFLSPEGQLMAFYNNKYSDIRIVKLPSMEVVIDQFYSNMPEKIYYHHTNYSSYVPWYSRNANNVIYAGKDKPFTYLHLDQDAEQGEEIGKDDFISYANQEGATVHSLPIAFNAYTIWAADFEFYVDILDLREIDKGILRKLDAKGFEMTRDGNELRNFIKVTIDPSSHAPDDMGVHADFEYLTKSYTDRLTVHEGKLELYNMYNKDNMYPQSKDHFTPYAVQELLPWQKFDAQQKERRANDEAAKNSLRENQQV